MMSNTIWLDWLTLNFNCCAWNFSRKISLAIKVSLEKATTANESSEVPRIPREKCYWDGYEMGKQEVKILQKLNELDPEQKE